MISFTDRCLDHLATLGRRESRSERGDGKDTGALLPQRRVTGSTSRKAGLSR